MVSLFEIGRRNQRLGRLSISSLTRRSCSTQLSCQHPNITVNRPACAFDITIGSFFYNFSPCVSLSFFFSSSERTDFLFAHHCYSPNSRLMLMLPVCLWHLVFHHQLQFDTLPHIQKKIAEERRRTRSSFLFFFFLFFSFLFFSFLFLLLLFFFVSFQSAIL